MFRLFFLILFSFPFFLFAQKGDFVIGIQSGSNISRTLVNTEFEGSPLKGDFFIGSSFGVIARSYLFKYKWAWGGFRSKFKVFAEYGLNATYGGYNYLYQEEATFQEQYHFQLPFLLVMRPITQKYWYKSWREKQLYPIVKSGFSFTTNSNRAVQKQYNFGEASIFEEVRTTRTINVHFVGAVGYQKELENGGIRYIGFSVHQPFFKNLTGSLRLESPQINEIASIDKVGNYYAIDIQYFFGEGNPQRRRKRFGKLPKVIYNPRF